MKSLLAFAMVALTSSVAGCATASPESPVYGAPAPYSPPEWYGRGDRDAEEHEARPAPPREGGDRWEHGRGGDREDHGDRGGRGDRDEEGRGKGG